jgi:hypothetical protein
LLFICVVVCCQPGLVVCLIHSSMYDLSVFLYVCFQAYYASSSAVEDETRFDAVQYDPRLGLAVEGLVEGITLDQLWRVM